MIIVWDEPKRQANLVKHGIDFADVGEGFFLSALVIFRLFVTDGSDKGGGSCAPAWSCAFTFAAMPMGSSS